MKFLPRIKQYLTRTRDAICPSKTKAQEADTTPRNYSILLDRWIPGVLFVLLCFLFVLLVGRLFFGPEATWLDCLLGTSDLEIEAKRETIKDLAQAVFGLILFLGLYIAFRRTRALEDTAKAQQKTAKAQQETTQAQQETAKAQNKTAQAQHNANEQKMFNDATAKLGDKSPSVRLGGIYALDRLARLNETYLASIVEILCAHLRETAQQDRDEDKDKEKYAEKYKDEPSNEIQSLLEVLSGLNKLSEEKKEDGQSNPVRLNLSGAYLVGANLTNACLNRANLSGTNMHKAYLSRAQLQEANLQEAQLQKTILYRAQMQKTLLHRAQMQAALLQETQMQKANLYRVRMQRTDLYRVRMQGANLQEAQMQGTSLSWVQLQGAVLQETQMQGASLSRIQLQGADLQEAQLQGAYLQEVQMQGASLSRVQLQGADLRSVQMQVQGAELQEVDLRSVQMQGANIDQMQVQGAELQEVDLRGAYCRNLDEELSVKPPGRIRGRQDKQTDLKTVIFSGGLKAKDAQRIRDQLTECQKNGWMIQEKVERIIAILEEHQGKPASNKPPSGTKTGSYDKKETEEIIAEYEKAMAGVKEDPLTE